MVTSRSPITNCSTRVTSNKHRRPMKAAAQSEPGKQEELFLLALGSCSFPCGRGTRFVLPSAPEDISNPHQPGWTGLGTALGDVELLVRSVHKLMAAAASSPRAEHSAFQATTFHKVRALLIKQTPSFLGWSLTVLWGLWGWTPQSTAKIWIWKC